MNQIHSKDNTRSTLHQTSKINNSKNSNSIKLKQIESKSNRTNLPSEEDLREAEEEDQPVPAQASLHHHLAVNKKHKNQTKHNQSTS